jgi:hypothetical protein
MTTLQLPCERLRFNKSAQGAIALKLFNMIKWLLTSERFIYNKYNFSFYEKLKIGESFIKP